MVRKSFVLIIILALALTTLACGFTVSIPEPDVKVGPEVTDDISVDVPDASGSTSLTLSFGAGELDLAPGAEGKLVTGTATYNVAEFKPQIKTNGAAVEINQGDKVTLNGVIDWNNVKNKWDLELGSEPMDLTIQAGAHQGKYELGGLSLTNLTVGDGAANVEMSFSEPNQAEMSVLRYETGASNVKVTELGNANFKSLIFKSGAGDYTLDFSGDLQRDGTVTIDSGLSNMILVIPDGVPAQVTVDGGLANISATSGWSQSGNTYVQEGDGSSLTIIVNMGAGNLTITH